MVSPHVHSVKERAQVNGHLLPDAVYIAHFAAFATKTKRSGLTYVEFLTTFALCRLFCDLGTPIAYWPKTLGGR